MENALRERIRTLLKVRKVTVNKLSSMSGISFSTLSGQINKETTISANTIFAVLAVFNDVSADWLMLGRGEMCTRSNTINNAHTHNGNANAGGSQVVNDQSALIAEKDKRIEELTRDKENLMALLTNITSK